MTPRRFLLLVLAVGLAVRLVNVFQMSRLPMAEYQFRAPEADMSLNYEWSGHILSGDLLGRDTVYQYTMWMREIAPLETWKRWWGGAHIFFQAPLYAYTLAAFRLLVGDHFWPIALCHVLLGLANVTLLFLLAQRLFGEAVAVLAAFGAALYGPFELHELFVLRDTLGVTVSLLMLWALARCHDVEPRPWLLAGLLLALATLCREATLLFAPLVAVWMLRRFHADWPALGYTALWFLAGLGLGLAPLICRNIVVGAPLLSLSAVGIEVFIHGNAPGSAGFGWRVPPETRFILEQAHGHLGTAVRLTLASYHGDWREFIALQTLKLRAIFSSYEATDNINAYYVADHLPLLRFSLHFEHILALGLIGLWLERANGARHRILRYFLAAAVGSLMYSTVVGRYRLAGTAVLLLYAAAAVHWAGGRFARSEWRALAFAGVAGVGIVLVSTNLLPAADRLRYPPQEYANNAVLYYQRGQVEEACSELRRGLDKVYFWPDRTALPPRYVEVLARPYVNLAHTLHRDVEAVAVLEGVASSFPPDAGLEELIGVLYRDGLNRPDEGARHLERARGLEAH
jgi:4-amino-4-deoxy-L-arabinose transferase-like glycosyltransferase